MAVWYTWAMFRLSRRWLGASLLLLALLAGLSWRIPGVRQYVGWYWSVARSRVYYALHPPEEAVFVPTPRTPLPASPTATARPTWLPATPTTTLPPSPTLAYTPTSLPPAAFVRPPRHEYQHWNNCAPATISMALAVWGWEGDQETLAAWLKPNPRDKNVFPHEIVQGVLYHTRFLALTRVAGTPALLRTFIAAGFPVVIEEGFEPANTDGWMGHYLLLWGYDDARARFYAHDSYHGPEQALPYTILEAQWRAFNFTFLVIYPPVEEARVQALLGPWREEDSAWHMALARAQAETRALSGRDQMFAWFNLGDSELALGDPARAAAAYDQAFAELAALPPDERPWRWMWYHDGPYRAYYAVGRYEDVIHLATTTLRSMSEPVLEEAYYWRGRAYAAQGKREAARADFQRALRFHPGYAPAQQALQALDAGGQP